MVAGPTPVAQRPVAQRPVAQWPVALTVAGSDSGGGAGIQADLRTFTAFGVWGTVAVTAVTAQGPNGVVSAEVMNPSLVQDQIEAVTASYRVAAVKTGMLGTAGVVGVVAESLDLHDLGPLVVDPVHTASLGGVLLEPEGLALMKERLLPRCTLFTPNIPEAEELLGGSISGRGDMPAAAAALSELGPTAVLLKGGHLLGGDCPDLLWEAGRATWIPGERVPVAAAHGTGCTLSAAITAQLARGVEVEVACRRAKEFVTDAITALLSGVPGDNS